MPSTSPEKLVAMQEHRSLTLRYHSELARYSTWLFGAVIVAMTFLLLAGLRSPKTLLLVFMYIALASFALSLLFYMLGSMLGLRLVMTPAASDEKADKKDKDASGSDRPSATSAVKVFRVLQQVLFVLGIVAMTGFAVEVALLFFPAASAASSSAAGAQ